MSNDELRVGDQERDRTAQALAEHFAAGRLTRDELDHRTGVVFRARTGLDLQEVLADLPPLAQRPAPAFARPVARPEPNAVAGKARVLWRSVGLAPWALFAVLFVVIWLVSGAGYFWPIWPIMGWGIGVAVTGVLAHTLPEVYLERHRHRHAP